MICKPPSREDRRGCCSLRAWWVGVMVCRWSPRMRVCKWGTPNLSSSSARANDRNAEEAASGSTRAAAVPSDAAEQRGTARPATRPGSTRRPPPAESAKPMVAPIDPLPTRFGDLGAGDQRQHAAKPPDQQQRHPTGERDHDHRCEDQHSSQPPPAMAGSSSRSGVGGGGSRTNTLAGRPGRAPARSAGGRVPRQRRTATRSGAGREPRSRCAAVPGTEPARRAPRARGSGRTPTGSRARARPRRPTAPPRRRRARARRAPGRSPLRASAVRVDAAGAVALMAPGGPDRAARACERLAGWPACAARRRAVSDCSSSEPSAIGRAAPRPATPGSARSRPVAGGRAHGATGSRSGAGSGAAGRRGCAGSRYRLLDRLDHDLAHDLSDVHVVSFTCCCRSRIASDLGTLVVRPGCRGVGKSDPQDACSRCTHILPRATARCKARKAVRFGHTASRADGLVIIATK